MRTSVLVLSIGLACAAPLFGGEAPANTWVKASGGPGSAYEGLVYDPVRGQVMQWANTPTDRFHNALTRVRHFDPARQDWVDDYPAVKNGTAYHYAKNWSMAGTLPHAFNYFDMAAFRPKSKEVVFSQTGMMAAYNPATKKWRKMKAGIELYGARYPGGPPVGWGAMCYDPLNDELVAFSHGGALNFDDWEATGYVGGHFGTLVFSFKDHLWRRLKPGSEKFKQGRALLRDTWWKEGRVVERAWRAELQRAWDPARHKKLCAEAATAQGEVLAETRKAAAQVQALAAGLSRAEEKERLGRAAKALAGALGEMEKAKAALASGKSYDGYRTAFLLVQKLRALYRFEVRAEPPARLNARMVYHPGTQSIVLFGGNHGDGCWNDTWRYDCKTRTWSESRSPLRPAPREQAALVYHAKSGLLVLAGGTLGVWRPFISDLWAYDVKADRWKPLAMGAPLKDRGPNRYMAACDAKADRIVLHRSGYGTDKGVTWTLRCDPARAGKAKGAPAWQPPLPDPFPRPDDPSVLQRLKTLPPNRWVDAQCPKNPPRKEWGSMGYDASSGFALLFGGGHSSYQGDDVTVYLPGANRWVFSHSPHSAAIPPQLKNAMGGLIPGHNLNGGLWAMHQRNTYEGAGGKMYLTMLTFMAQPHGPPKAKAWYARCKTRWPNVRNGFWEYDLDRRLWRTLLAEGTERRISNMFSMGKRIGGLAYASRNGYPGPSSGGWYEYTPSTNKAILHPFKGKLPNRSGEGRHYAYLKDRHALFLACNDPKAPLRTYLYDLKTNTLRDLKPKASPPASRRIYNVLYMPDQQGAWAWLDVNRKEEQWVYSFALNTWKKVDAPRVKGSINAGPYEQVIYSEKYKVFVWGGGRGPTGLLRPDLSRIK